MDLVDNLVDRVDAVLLVVVGAASVSAINKTALWNGFFRSKI